MCLVGVALLVLLGCCLVCFLLLFDSAWWNRGIAEEVTMASYGKAVTGTAVMARSANEEKKKSNVLDEVGAEAPCVTDEPEAETLPSGEPSSSSHPSSSTPRVSGPSLPWIDVNDELEWPGGPPKYDPFDRPRSRSPRTN